jgi:uncharacterized membrane protein
MQSPDEYNHLERAYLLSKGELRLERSDDKLLGGFVDTGLLAYMFSLKEVPYHPEVKVDHDLLKNMRQISWSHHEEFLIYKNTPIYGPLVYLPQAAGLSIGKFLDFSIHHSYMLARFLPLLFSILMIAFAAKIFPVPPLAFGILFTPISLFQLSTTSPDGLSYALSILVLSLFSKVIFQKEQITTTLILLFAFSSFALITRFFSFIPIVLMPFIAYLIHKETKYIYLSLLILCSSLLWIAFAFTMPTMPSTSILNKVTYYLTSPLELVKVYFNTVSTYGILRNNLYELIGRLGWQDTKINGKIFYVVPLFYLIYVSIIKSKIGLFDFYRKSLFYLAIASIFLVLFMLLVGWTVSHPAKRIDGVTGRYFIPIMYFFAYAYGPFHMKLKSYKMIYVIILLLLVISSVLIVMTMFQRYWLN